jgi:hypothetical protein
MAKLKLKQFETEEFSTKSSGEFSYVELVFPEDSSHNVEIEISVWDDGELGITLGKKGTLLTIEEVEELLKVRRRVMKGLQKEELVVTVNS